MEKWSSREVFDYWLKSHGHKFPKWNKEWDKKFLEHSQMEFITSVDASWIKEAINEYRNLDSVAARIQNRLELDRRKKDPSGLYSKDEKGWW